MAIRPPSEMIAPNDIGFRKNFQVHAVVTSGGRGPPFQPVGSPSASLDKKIEID
jgi:hypothetical protein